MMTREEKLYSMTMGCLVEVANKLGIKIDKKGAKAKAVAKILEAEKKQAEAVKIEKPSKKVDDSKLVPMPGAEKLAELKEEYCGDGTKLADVGKEIAEQAKQKAKKKQKVETKKVDVAKPSKEVAIEIIKQSGFDFVEKAKKDIVVDPIAKIAVVYVGAKSFTVYFNGDVVKATIEKAGFNVIESKEKFEYFSKIDTSTLESVIKALSKA